MARLSVAQWLEILHANGVAVVDTDAVLDAERLMLAWGVGEADDRSTRGVPHRKVGVEDAADVFAARLATTPEQYTAIRRHFIRYFTPLRHEDSLGPRASDRGALPSEVPEPEPGAWDASARGPDWLWMVLAVVLGGTALWFVLHTSFETDDTADTETSTSGATNTGDDADTSDSTDGRGEAGDSTQRSATTSDDGSGDATTGNVPTDAASSGDTATIERVVQSRLVETRPAQDVEREEELPPWHPSRFLPLLLWPGLVAFGLLTLGQHWLRTRAVVDQTTQRQRKQGMAKRKRGRQRDGPGFGEPYQFKAPAPMDSTTIDAAGDQLARPPDHEEGSDLDVPRSLDRTIRAGGCPQPRFARTKRQAPLLVLVDVEEHGGRGQAHPLAHAAEWILQRWKRTGLRYERYDYTGVPDTLRHHGSARELSLEALARRHGGARLLVWSRMRRPFDAQHRMEWLTALTRWPRRAWIDLDPRPACPEHDDPDGRDDAAVERVATMKRAGLVRYPLSRQGLLAAARHVAGRGDVPPPVQDEARPHDAERLDDALAHWAAAACCVPDPTWMHLDALRTLLPQVRRTIPEARGVWWLLRWLHDKGCLALPPEEARHRLALTNDAEVHLLGGKPLRLEVDGESHEVEQWVRGRLVEQLRDAAPRTDNDAWRQQAKLAFHRCSEDLKDCLAKLKSLLGTPADGLARHLLERIEDRLSAGSMHGLGEREQREAADAVRGALGGRVWARQLLGQPTRGEMIRAGGGALALVVVTGVMRPMSVTTVRKLATEYEVIQVWTEQKVTKKDEAPTEGSVEKASNAGHLPLAKMVSLDLPLFARPMRLLEAPPGRFWMGSQPEIEPDRDTDERLHVVQLSRGFLVCETEVTQAQWEAMMGPGTNPSDCDRGCGNDLPVHDVSWEMALEYLNALSVHEGLEPCYTKRSNKWKWENDECKGYRLPTEAEWEYVARAGQTRTSYSFGNDASRLGDYAWHDANSDGEAHPVGTKMANPWGLYDVHGNVYEWVWDRYEADYGDKDRLDPTGPSTGDYRVLRGGSSSPITTAEALRSASRIPVLPNFDFHLIGFRCVRGTGKNQQ